MTKFPGHGLGPNGSFQFVEGEYMKPEDYDTFVEDPADWAIRKYWPRVFSELEGLAGAITKKYLTKRRSDTNCLHSIETLN
jgi:hypothetical protein